jgi:glutamine cyclotransferase
VRRSPLRLACVIFWLAAAALGQSASPTQYTFKVVRQFPHDPSAFTQGFAYQDGYFYEGTGLNGKSSLRQVEVKTGAVVKQVDLPTEYFGEGIAILKNQVVQLTWQSHAGFVYRLKDFHQLKQFSYPGEGWGLTSDGRQFFLSDGTSEIRILDPVTFAEKRRIKVRDGATAITELNELEFVDGQIWANIWMTDRIVRISPATGKIFGWIDLKGLLSPIYRLAPEAVLNGIAYDSQNKRLFVTGKLWPAVFEIKVLAKKR